MHLFKHFFKMTGKYKTGLVIYGIIFLVMIIASMGSNLFMGDTYTQTDSEAVGDKRLTIGYVDEADSELSRGLISCLSTANDMKDLKDRSEDNIKTMVYFTTVSSAIRLEKDFDVKVEKGDSDAVTYQSAVTDGPSMYIMETQINNYLDTYKLYKKLGYGESDAIAKASDALSEKVKTTAYNAGEGSTISLHNKDFIINTVSKFFIWMSFSTLTLSIGNVIVKNNNDIVNKRVNVAPIKPGKMSLTNAAGLLVCGIILWLIMSGVIWLYAYDTTVWKEYGYVIVLTLLATVISNCAMTSFISSFKVNEDSLPMIANVVGLGLSFASGAFVPQYLLGEKFLGASKFFPFYWAVRTLDSISPSAGSSIEYTPAVLWSGIGVMMLCAAAFTVGGVVVRKTIVNKNL